MLATQGVTVRRRWQKRRQFLPPVLPTRDLSLEQFKVLTRPNALDRRFRPVDRLLRSWAVSQGSGLPLEADQADALPSSRPPPLPDDVATLVDQILLDRRTLADIRRLIFSWYRSPKPREAIAAELGVTVRTVYHEHRIALAYLLGRFTEAGLNVPTWEAD